MRNVTLRELAEKAGCSKSTAHRALAGSGSVKEATQKRVREVADQLGYKVDPYFSSMAAKRRGGQTKLKVHYLYGGLHPSSRQTGVNDFPFFQEAGEAVGIQVEAVHFEEMGGPGAILRTLYHRGSDGLIVGNIDPEFDACLLNGPNLPIICCPRIRNLPFTTVRYSSAASVRLCWKKLRQLGYRRIGFGVMTHPDSVEDDDDRIGAALHINYRWTAPENRVPILSDYIFDTQAFVAWAKAHRPEAIIGFRVGLEAALRENGVDDMAYVCLHSRPGPIRGDVPGAYQPRDMLALEALQQLSEMIRLGQCGAINHAPHIVLSPQWRDGGGIPARQAQR